MNAMTLVDFRRGLWEAKRLHGYDRLHENGTQLADDFNGVSEALTEIESLTLVIDNPERLRGEVRTIAAKAIQDYVLK